MSKTPLQVYVELISSSSAPSDARKLRALARQHSRTRREQEIAEYLIRASGRRLKRQEKAGNSLKHVLWQLRDIAGEVYEPAAREVLQYVLEHEKIPLSNVLPHVRHMRIAGVYYDAINQPINWRSLEKHLEERRVGSLRVAVNTTTRNLTGVAMRLGYDVMVARSQKGAVVKASDSYVVTASLLPRPNNWTQVYQDLAMWTEESPAPSVEDILNALEKAIQRR